jgi:hypothetical protein
MSDVVSPVLITCPNTGEAVPTVMRLRPSAFEALRGEYSFRCTRCGEIHRWTKDAAWLKVATPAPTAAGVVKTGG